MGSSWGARSPNVGSGRTGLHKAKPHCDTPVTAREPVGHRASTARGQAVDVYRVGPMAPDARKAWIIVGSGALAAITIGLGLAALSGWLVDSGDRVPESARVAVELE